MKTIRSLTGKPVALDPIWPNAGVGAWYRSQMEYLVYEAFSDLQRRVKTAWEKTPPLFPGSHITQGYGTDIAMDAPSPTKNLDIALRRWGTDTIANFNKASDKISKDFASRSQRATQAAMLGQLKKAGFTVVFKPTRRAIEAFHLTIAANVQLISSLGTKFTTDISQKVWSAVRAGSDLYTLSVDLRQTYGITIRRAALIARDQNAKAKAVMERERQLELGFKRGIWMHSHAGKEPRPTHVKENGKTYKLAKGFYDTDEGEWVHPGQLINCRCSMRPILEGFNDTNNEDVTNVELREALNNAVKYEGKARGQEMYDILQELREGRRDWKGPEASALRGKIDEYLSE